MVSCGVDLVESLITGVNPDGTGRITCDGARWVKKVQGKQRKGSSYDELRVCPFFLTFPCSESSVSANRRREQ